MNKSIVLLAIGILALTVVLLAGSNTLAMSDPFYQAPTPTPTQTPHYYMVDFAGGASATSLECVHDAGLYGTTELLENYSNLVGIVVQADVTDNHPTLDKIWFFAADLWLGAGNYVTGSSSEATDDDGCWAKSGWTAACGAMGFPFTGGMPADSHSATAGSEVDLGFGIQSFCGEGQFASVTVGAVKLIYYGSNDPADEPCEEYETYPGTGGNIPADLEEGVELELIPNTLYELSTTDGPWLDDGGGSPLYLVDITDDGGETWVPLGTYGEADCVNSEGDNYVTIYFETGSTTANLYYLRVSDVPGDFEANTGSMGYTISQAIIPDPDPDPYGNPLCDGDMEQYPLSECWIEGEGAQNGQGGFGRLNNSNPFHGDAACHNGFQAVGADFVGGVITPDQYSDVWQGFDWEGGDLFWRAMVRANNSTTQQDSSATWEINIIDSEGTTHNYSGTATRQWQEVSGIIYDAPAGIWYGGGGGGIGYQIFLTKGAWGDNDTVYFDDVSIANTNPASACDPPPTATVTPTPTPSTNINLIQNCGFENGLVPWYPSSDGGAGRSLDDPYQGDWAGYMAPTEFLRQNFVATNTVIWVEFYARFLTGHGYGEVEVKNLFTGQTVTRDIHASYYNGWDIYGFGFEFSGMAPDAPEVAQYQLTFRNTSGPPMQGTMFIDNVGVGQFGYVSCIGGPSATNTPLPTPTGGFTITPFATNTPTRTPSPWPTWTPYPTYTALPTYTPPPTYTPAPTSTQTDPELTATAAGTVIATYTIQPSATMYATSTQPAQPSATPPIGITPQPIVQGCTVECIDPGNAAGSCQLPIWPDYGTGLDNWIEEFIAFMREVMIFAGCTGARWVTWLGAWPGYAICEAERYSVWCPYHSATVVAIPTMAIGKEPFGTINEVQEAATSVAVLINQYDWGQTGVTGIDESSNPGLFLTPDAEPSLLDGGSFNLDDYVMTPAEMENMDVPQEHQWGYLNQCSFAMRERFGQWLSEGVCFSFNTLRNLSLLPFFQVFINLSALFTLFYWMFSRIVDPIYGGG